MSRHQPVFREGGVPFPSVGGWLLCVWLLLLCAACGDPRPLIDEGGPPSSDGAAVRVEPAEISAFGNVPVTIVQRQFTFDPTLPIQVVLDARRCLDVQLFAPDALGCVPQGGPEKGGVWLSLDQGDESIRVFGTLGYRPPLDPIFSRMVALGLDLTAGVSGGALTPDSQRQSIPAFLARQAGAYFPMPLVARPGLPPDADLHRLDPLTGTLPADWDSAFFAALLAENPDGENLRADGSLVVQNLAVPKGPGAFDLLRDEPLSERGDFYTRALFHATGDDEPRDPLENLERLSPTFVFAGFDFFDTLGRFGSAGGETPSPELMQAQLETLLGRILAASSRPVLLLMNLPPGNLWPGEAYSEWRRYESIWTNRALHDAALLLGARYPRARLLVVDTFSFVFQIIEARGEVERFGQRAVLEAGKNGETDLLVTDAAGQRQRLGFDRMQGLFSLDGKTFTATANALFANLAIETLNNTLGPDAATPLMAHALPYIDIGEVMAADPQSPVSLAERLEGMTVVPPDRLADPTGLPSLHPAQRCAMSEASGMRPPPEQCPVEILISDAQGNVPQAQAGGTVQLLLRLRGLGGATMEAYPLAVHARDGRVTKGELLTDDRGHATLRYTAPAGPGHDTLTVVCGGVRSRIQIPISD